MQQFEVTERQRADLLAAYDRLKGDSMGNKVRPGPAQVFSRGGQQFSTRSSKPAIRRVAKRLARRAAVKKAVSESKWTKLMGAGDALEAGQGPGGKLID